MKRLFALFAAIVLLTGTYTVSLASADPYEGKHIIILRLDDLQSKTTGAFEWVLNTALEKNVKVSFGVIGDNLEDSACNQRFIDFMKYTDSLGMEIWHHGYIHTNTEYKGSSYEKQLESFKRTYELMEQKCGISMHTFGPPYNVSDNTTIKMITENFPGINVFMSVTDSDNLASQTKLNDRIIIESTTGIIDYEKFETSYESAVAKNRKCSVILGHPAQWNETSRQYFLDIIDFLKARDCVFMTPYEYYCYKNNISMSAGTPMDFNDHAYVMLKNHFVDFVTYPEIDAESNKVFAPARSFFEALNAAVRYNPEQRGYTINYRENIMQFTAGSTDLFYNGNIIRMPYAPKMINGCLMVDIEFLSTLLNMNYYFDNERKLAYINSSVRKDESLEITGSSASYYLDYNPSFFSYDGNSKTFWKTNGGSDKYITYNLGSLCNVSSVDIEWGSAGAGFEISVSADAETWTTAYSGKKTTGVSFENFPLTEANAVQYVRFISLAEKSTIINEFYIQGDRIEALPEKSQPEIIGKGTTFAYMPSQTEFEFTAEQAYKNLDTVMSAPYCTSNGNDITESVQNGIIQLEEGQTIIAHYGSDAEFYCDFKEVTLEKTTLYENIALPGTCKYGSTVSWQSDNEAYITIKNGTAVVRHYDTDSEEVPVTLTATVSNGAKSDTKVFNVTVGLIDEFSSVVSEDTNIRTGKATKYGTSKYLRVGAQATPTSTGSYQALLRFNCESIKSRIATADYIAIRLKPYISSTVNSTVNTINVYGISTQNLWQEESVNATEGNGPTLVKYTDNHLGEYVTLGMSEEILEIDITDFAKSQENGIIEIKLSATTPDTEVFGFYTKESDETPPTLIGYSHDKGKLYGQLNNIDLGDITAVQQNIVLPSSTDDGTHIDWDLTVNASGTANLRGEGILEISSDADNETCARAVLCATVNDGVNTAQKCFNILVRNGILLNKIYFVQDNKILSVMPEGTFNTTVKINNTATDNMLCLAFYENRKLLRVETVSSHTSADGYDIYTLSCENTDSNTTNIKAFLINKETIEQIVKPENISPM